MESRVKTWIRNNRDKSWTGIYDDIESEFFFPRCDFEVNKRRGRRGGGGEEEKVVHRLDRARLSSVLTDSLRVFSKSVLRLRLCFPFPKVGSFSSRGKGTKDRRNSTEFFKSREEFARDLSIDGSRREILFSIKKKERRKKGKERELALL